MKMKVYLSRKRNLQGELTAIVIETDLNWAVSYWTKRKMTNPELFWEFV